MSEPAIKDPKAFEQSMLELEQLVDQLERGELTLEASLDAFERGIKLTRACQQALEQAEQRVRLLSPGAESPEAFAADDGASGRGSVGQTPDDRA